MPIEQILTIGVYGYTEESFFAALENADVDLLLDVRQRRGVRGPDYAFANYKHLVAGLEKRDIGYLHVLRLAPTTEIRESQYVVDRAEHVAQRKRDHLAPEFIAEYQRLVLDRIDLESIARELDQIATVVALMCVERLPSACHRSLAAAALSELRRIQVVDLVSE